MVSFSALHWVLDQQAALSSIRAALKPGGRALLRMVSKGDRKSIEAVVDETRGELRWASYFTGFRGSFAHFTPEDYVALAKRSGLAVQQTKVEDRAWDFQTRDAFAALKLRGLYCLALETPRERLAGVPERSPRPLLHSCWERTQRTRLQVLPDAGGSEPRQYLVAT